MQNLYSFSANKIQKEQINFVSFKILNDEGILNLCTSKYLTKVNNYKIIFSFSRRQSQDIYERNLNRITESFAVKPEFIASCEQVHPDFASRQSQ